MADWYIVYGEMTQYFLAFPSKTNPSHICVFAENEEDAMKKTEGYCHDKSFKPQRAVPLNKRLRYQVYVVH